MRSLFVGELRCLLILVVLSARRCSRAYRSLFYFVLVFPCSSLFHSLLAPTAAPSPLLQAINKTPLATWPTCFAYMLMVAMGTSIFFLVYASLPYMRFLLWLIYSRDARSVYASYEAVIEAVVAMNHSNNRKAAPSAVNTTVRVSQPTG